MDRRQIGMKLTLEALDISLSVDTFDDRLVIQKAIYLAQAAGIQLGYYHRWYIRGPYAPALAEDAFAAIAETRRGDDDSAGWNLDPMSVERARNLTTLFEPPEGQSLTFQLEILASVHYLVSHNLELSNNATTLTQRLRQADKTYSEDEVAKALMDLTTNALLPK